MKIKNPARHFPAYCARLYLQDGTRRNIRGTATAEIDLRVDEDEVRAVVLECLDTGRAVRAASLLVGGKWLEYTEEALEAVLCPPKPEPETESETEPETESSTKLDVRVDEDVDEDDDDENDDYGDDGRFGLGCT